jgi:hypothetical protein
MVHDSIPGRPTLPQVVAHALLLQSILGYEGLSAGVWYIAIDFQLFALLVGSAVAGSVPGARQYWRPTVSALLVVTLALASLYYFNRDGDWDKPGASTSLPPTRWASVTYWATQPQQTLGWLLPMVGLVVIRAAARLPSTYCRGAAGGADARPGTPLRFLDDWPRSRLIAYLGQISYSVFLVHFPDLPADQRSLRALRRGRSLGQSGGDVHRLAGEPRRRRTLLPFCRKPGATRASGVRTRSPASSRFLEPGCCSERKVTQNTVSTRPFAGQQALENTGPLVQPAILRGGLEHCILAADLIDVGWHLELVLDPSDDIEVRHPRFDHHHVGPFGEVKATSRSASSLFAGSI